MEKKKNIFHTVCAKSHKLVQGIARPKAFFSE